MATNIQMTKTSERIPDVSHVLWFNSSALSHKHKNLLWNTCLPAYVCVHKTVWAKKRKSRNLEGINSAGEKQLI